MNKLKNVFKNSTGSLLNIYFTAGHPSLDSITEIIKALDQCVDIIEIGMPYSDPLADGPTIQMSSAKALNNGLNLEILFDKITAVKDEVDTPLVLMGYLNQLMQYGIEKFLKTASQSGVSGLIIPDLPMDIYESEYQLLFKKYDLCHSFLITPNTNDERIQKAASLSDGFLYIVAQSSITGKNGEVNSKQQAYFKKIKDMQLDSPTMIGFGIHNEQIFKNACQYADGAIIGSAFIKMLASSKEANLNKSIKTFVSKIKGN